MKVKKIMSAPPQTVTPETSLHEAARIMQKDGIGLLPVMEGQKVVGVLTDRDMIVGAMSHGWVPDLTKARDVMKDLIVWCFEDATVKHAARLMGKKQVHRLLVFARDMTLAGVVSLDDIALALRNEGMVGQTLRNVSSPVVASRARTARDR